MPTTLPKRSEVPRERTWDLESIYPTTADWERAFATADAELPGLARFQGRLAESPAGLLEWFQTWSRLGAEVNKVSVYARLRFDVDTTDQESAALNGRAQGLAARFAAAAAFAEPELLAVDPAVLEGFMAAEPELAVYRHYLDNLRRQREHVRSAEVEELLARASEPLGAPWNAYTSLADGDLQFRPVRGADGQERPVARGTITELLHSPDRALRRAAYESYADGFLGVRNTMAALISGNVRANVFRARVRRYPSALEASLAASNIPLAVFENVIDAANRHLPIWHRYWEVRRRALGLERLEPLDIFAPLAQGAPDVPYETAVEWICAGMAPLGEEYVGVMRRGLLEERWVDIEPNQGKRGGAYSSGSYGTRPFILMSYTGGLSSLSTLAHELGHSMHSYLARAHQPFVYSRYALFVAEVASNFNQALVRAHLLRQSQEREFQVAVIEEAMQNFHRYLFVMPILAQFERQIHERVEAGQALTADAMTGLLAELFRRGYGPAVALDEAREGVQWAQFPHMYMNFYVYQYASGIAAANALADALLAGEAGAAGRYLQFLRAGGSLYPLEALRLAGIDMASPVPMDRAFGVLERFVTRLEELIPPPQSPPAAGPR
ncbi:MAG TPA: oligoendopeptidase F [Roseiflexaceae bacterium]|nr:oligoendopeptidase F [Roseiflexaceae bacterium]